MHTEKQVSAPMYGKPSRRKGVKFTFILRAIVLYGKLPSKIYGMVAYALTDLSADMTTPHQLVSTQPTISS